MSDLLALAAAALMLYVGVGLLALVSYDHVTDGGVTDRDQALAIVTNWPTIAIVAAAGAYALWATQREVDTLGGER